MTKLIRVSASRLKTLKECSLAFWYSQIQQLPEDTHWKTKVGSIVHLVFECLLNPRRATLLKTLLLSDSTTFVGILDLTTYPHLARFVAWQLRRYEVTLSSVGEIGELLRVALIGIRPYYVTADGEYTPPSRVLREHRFQMQVGQAVMSGFIDVLLGWDNRMVCIDLKSQRDKFVRAEVPNLIQAAIYQLACQRDFGFIPPVEFILLRHPPSKRYPKMHIQRTEAPSPTHLRGLEAYIEGMYGIVNQFGMEEALAHPHDSVSFCTHVCRFYKPFTYWARMKGDETIDTYVEGQQPVKLDEGETLVKREHKGCLSRWRGDGA